MSEQLYVEIQGCRNSGRTKKPFIYLTPSVLHKSDHVLEIFRMYYCRKSRHVLSCFVVFRASQWDIHIKLTTLNIVKTGWLSPGMLLAKKPNLHHVRLTALITERILSLLLQWWKDVYKLQRVWQFHRDSVLINEPYTSDLSADLYWHFTCTKTMQFN